MKHVGTKRFETERLLCRRFEESDCTDMFRNWAANPNIQHEYGEPVYSSLEAVKGLLQKYIDSYRHPDVYRWAIVEKASGENIGQIAFCRVYSDAATAEIEYCIGERFWGKGYAGEALFALLDFTFRNMSAELELRRCGSSLGPSQYRLASTRRQPASSLPRSGHWAPNLGPK